MAADCAEIFNQDSNDVSRDAMERSILNEHRIVLKKASRSLLHKWSNKLGRQSNTQAKVMILDPTELPTAIGLKTDDDKAGTVAGLPPTLNTRVSPWPPTRTSQDDTDVVDPEQNGKEAQEERINASLSRRTKQDDQSALSVTKFWIDVLGKLDDDYDEADEGLYEEDSKSDEMEDESNEDDMPQFTLPAYAQAATSSRKKRRTYRPEQINFDFMKGWTDTRDQPLLGPNPPIENLSKLKNYRANKIRLADFFSSDQPEASHDSNKSASFVL